jgi:hypothetical protein
MPGRKQPHPLDDRALLTLQLVARGYTPAQIALLREAPAVEVLQGHMRAGRLLGAGTVRAAVDEYAPRGRFV